MNYTETEKPQHFTMWGLNRSTGVVFGFEDEDNIVPLPLDETGTLFEHQGLIGPDPYVLGKDIFWTEAEALAAAIAILDAQLATLVEIRAKHEQRLEQLSS